MALHDTFHVTLGSLDDPAERLKWIGNDVRTTIHSAAGTQTDAAATAASNSDVSEGCDAFKAAVQAALKAFGVDTEVLGTNVGKAKVQYQTTDTAAKVDVELPLIPGIKDPDVPSPDDTSSSGVQ